MEDLPYESTMRAWLILSGAVSILENEGLEIAGILQKYANAQATEAYYAITTALYWLKDETGQLIASTVSKRKA